MADISSITLPGGGTYDLKDKNAVHTSSKGAANGVASLDSTGKVPSSQLPSISIDYLTVVNGKICVIYEVTP